MLDLQAKTLFKIPPILEGQVEESLCQAILHSAYDAQSKDPSGQPVSSAGGWQSQSFRGGAYDSMDHLIDNFLTPAAVQIYNKFGLRENVTFDNYWFNINQRYNYNQSHIHPGSFLSGVLYLKVPENSGNIKFYNPDPFEHQLIPVNKYSREFPGSYSIVPTVGKLIFFPSYFSHSVTQNLTEEQDDRRISVSFNLR